MDIQRYIYKIGAGLGEFSRTNETFVDKYEENTFLLKHGKA